MTSNFHELGGVNVSRETYALLEWYCEQVRKWNKAINLVARSTLENIWDRHIVDSAQVFSEAPEAQLWLDIGSGGGFPGAIVSILAKELRPDLQMILMDSDLRKCTFLRTIVREAGLNARVECSRIEDANPLGADVLSARALADLPTLIGFCERHLDVAGTALLQKGENWKVEDEQARQKWKYDLEIQNSVTESKAVVMKIRNIARV